MENKLIKLLLVIVALTIEIGSTSCKKECMDKFKQEMSNEFKKDGSNCNSGPDTIHRPVGNNSRFIGSSLMVPGN